MKRVLLAAAALACTGVALLPASAPAQLAPGYSGTSGIQYMGREEIWFAIRQLGDCLARGRRRASAALLATVPGSPQEAAASRALVGNNVSCIQSNTRMGVPRDFIRGAVAEGMYRRYIGTPPPPQPLDPKADATDPAPTLLVDFARCFAQVRPQAVHDLLTTTRLGTHEEHDAFVRLAPELGQCIPAGLNLALGAPVVRLALAGALYDRAMQVRGAAQGARR